VTVCQRLTSKASTGSQVAPSSKPLKSALSWPSARLHSDPDRLDTSQQELPFLVGTREERSCSRRVVVVSSLPLHGAAYARARTMVDAASVPGVFYRPFSPAALL
jgi:hypothetical protein